MNCSELSAFTESGLIVSHDGTNDAQNEGGVSNLGLTPPASPKIIWIPPFKYFITVAFPLNALFKIKHQELMAQGLSKFKFSPIKYGDCTFNEQYRWILHILTKNIYAICDRYDLFFELTQKNNIHFHGRLGYEADSKVMFMKDIRVLIHRMFDCSTQYIRFVDIKKYDHTKWNDYETKYKKTYQTVKLPHFQNVDDDWSRNY